MVSSDKCDEVYIKVDHDFDSDSSYSNSSDSIRGTDRSSVGYFWTRSPRAKFIIMAVFLFFCSLSNNVVMAVIHDLVPKYPPLPDVVFGVFDEAKHLLEVTEFLVMLSGLTAVIMILYHSHRWLYASRVAFIAALLYLGRAVCIGVTLVPVTSPNFACDGSTDNRSSVLSTLYRVGRHMFSLGFEASGLSVACGDYIYSGHTVVTVLASLISTEYCPKRLRSWAPKVMYFVSFLAMLGIIVTRLHYTIDVILAYFLTTRLFWNYHIAVAVRRRQKTAPLLKQRGDLISAILWYPFVEFIEDDS